MPTSGTRAQAVGRGMAALHRPSVTAFVTTQAASPVEFLGRSHWDSIWERLFTNFCDGSFTPKGCSHNLCHIGRSWWLRQLIIIIYMCVQQDDKWITARFQTSIFSKKFSIWNIGDLNSFCSIWIRGKEKEENESLA